MESKQKNITSFSQRLASAAVNLAESPWGASLIALLVYLMISIYSGDLFEPSSHAYYNYLADAFLHGQTWLRILPPSILDLSILNGKFYLYWAPFPAIILMPFVAIFGVQLNDVLYTILIAVINVGLVAKLLRVATHANFLYLSKPKRAILVMFFAFGTVHLPLAPFGKVWTTGQLLGFTCVLLAYIATFTLKGFRAWFFTGLALACAMLTRTQMVFTGIFPLVYLLGREKPWSWPRIFSVLAWAAFPLITAGAMYLFYNQVRFGSPFDVGYAYHNMADFFRADFERYSLFNLHYVPINLYYQLLFYPFPFRPNTLMGGSLFLLSPLFFGAFAAFYKPRSKLHVWALLASILVTYIPIVLLMGTGFLQFGPRYTLDFTVPLILLTALGIEKWKIIIPVILLMLSIIQYLMGINGLT